MKTWVFFSFYIDRFAYQWWRAIHRELEKRQWKVGDLKGTTQYNQMVTVLEELHPPTKQQAAPDH